MPSIRGGAGASIIPLPVRLGFVGDWFLHKIPTTDSESDCLFVKIGLASVCRVSHFEKMVIMN